ncbi:MAG: oligosaccharide flippase family protein, partial [Burkholderiaceae bacterium]
FATGRELLFAATSAIRVTAIGAIFGTVSAGYFAMSMRLLDAPVKLMYAALTTTTTRALSDLSGDRKMSKEYLHKWLLLLALAGLVLLVSVSVFANIGVEIVLGAEWTGVGSLLVIIAVWKSVGLCKAPAVAYLYVHRQDKNTFYFQLAGTIATALAVAIVIAVNLGFVWAVLLIALIGLGVDSSFVLSALRLSRRR